MDMTAATSDQRPAKGRFASARTLFLLVIAWSLVAGHWSLAAAQDLGLDIGARAPTAALETLDGKPVDLARHVGKEPVVMEFWATWCPSCEELGPYMKAMHAKYGRRVRFVNVAVSINQAPARVKRYVAKHRIPGEHYFDRKGAASGAYDVPATSYVVVIDRAGRVAYTGLGGKQPGLEKVLRAVAK